MGSGQTEESYGYKQDGSTKSLNKQLDWYKERYFLLSEVIDRAPVLMYLLDIKTMELVWVNQEVRDFVGYNAQGIKILENGQFIQSVHKGDYGLIKKLREDFLNDRLEQHFGIFRLLDTDRVVHYFNFIHTVFKRDKHNLPDKILGVAMDINENLQSAEHFRLIISDDMEQTDKLIKQLNKQQLSILEKLAEGKTYDGIAREMHLSMDGVRYHIRKLYQILDVHSRSEAISRAMKYGIVKF